MFNNMRIKFAPFVCFITVLSCRGETMEEIQRMREMVVSASEEVSVHTRKAAHIYGNFDGEGPWCVQFRQLADRMVTLWATAVSHFDEIARTDTEKAMVICAWQAMGPRYPEDYLKCLQAAAGLVEQGKLDRELFRQAQSPLLNVPYDTLAYEYRNPVAQDVLKRSKVIFHDVPERLAWYDWILSGEGRKAQDKGIKDLNWWKHPPEDMEAGGGTAKNGFRDNDGNKSLGKKRKEVAESPGAGQEPASPHKWRERLDMLGFAIPLLVGLLLFFRRRGRRNRTPERG